MFKVLEKLGAVYGELVPLSVDETAGLDRAMVRLGCELPYTLRELYVRTGGTAPLHRGYNVLLGPDDLFVREEKIVFYRERESACYWAASLGAKAREDSPIYSAYEFVGDVEWVCDFESVGEFFLFQGAWQAVHGGLAWCGLTKGLDRVIASARSSQIRRVFGSLAELVLVHQGSEVWLIGSCVAFNCSDGDFGLASRARDQFVAVSAALEIGMHQWAYVSIRDDT